MARRCSMDKLDQPSTMLPRSSSCTKQNAKTLKVQFLERRREMHNSPFIHSALDPAARRQTQRT